MEDDRIKEILLNIRAYMQKSIDDGFHQFIYNDLGDEMKFVDIINAIETILAELEKYKKLYITTLGRSLNNSITQSNKEKDNLEALNEGWKIELENNYISKDKIKDIIHNLDNDIDYWRSDCLRDLEKLLK